MFRSAGIGHYELCMDFEDCGICEALMIIMKNHMHDNGIIRDILRIINYVVDKGDDVHRLLDAGIHDDDDDDVV
jgi:hypothetical protein